MNELHTIITHKRRGGEMEENYKQSSFKKLYYTINRIIHDLGLKGNNNFFR